ncbi:MAG TPA: cell division protein FtsZ, partial [Alphaproteobacteria bacterium]|nr:cell division protein FtsZ [Alphaproteobacteria bacterium]
AAPVIARAAREAGILTVGVVTKPFHFEGVHRMRAAEKGIEELQRFVDTLIIIPNQNLFRIANEKTTFADAFKMADDVLHSGVRGVTDLMVMPGLINLDFADIRTVMGEMGKAMMGTGEAEGDRRSVNAAEAAISNPLLDDVSMKGARGVLINITGGMDMTLYEVDEAANRIRDEVDADANIIFGSTFDESMEGRVRVSVVATGIDLETATGTRPTVSNLSLVSDRTKGDAPKGGGFGPGRAAPGRPAAVGNTRMAASPVTTAATALKQMEMEPELEPELLPEEEHEPEGAMDTSEPAHHGQPVYAQPTAETAEPPRGERRDGQFIAPRQVQAPLRSAAMPARSQSGAYPEAEAGNGSRMMEAARRRGSNIFRRMTGLLREEDEAVHGQQDHARAPMPQQPAPRTEPRMGGQPQHPAQTSYGAAPEQPAQPRFAGFDNHRGPLPSAEDDQLDIPAFLRRQAN